MAREASAPAVADRLGYMVIHLNVEPGPQAPPSAPANACDAAPGGDAPPRPVFSDSFLKKEFPHFYEERPAADPPASRHQHPAQQLQAFLNAQGVNRWELVGLFPVGALPMLFFRHRLPSAAQESPELEARGGQSAVADKAQAEDQGARTSAPADSLLETQLARISALEVRLPPSGDRARLDGQDLSAAELASLASEPAMVGQAAAQALGLRSAASLANHGARHGCGPGLCKQGPNGMVAVYRGSGASERGGSAPRLWIVVNRDRLRG